MRINAPEKMKLFSYLVNSTSMLLVNLERMIFVTNHIKDTGLTGSFTYESSTGEKDRGTEKGELLRLVTHSRQLASIRFSNISGNIIAARSYTAPVSETCEPTAA